MRSSIYFCALALFSFFQTAHAAQHGGVEDPYAGAEIQVEIKLDFRHLSKDVGAIAVFCGVTSLFDETEFVGEGMVFMYDGAILSSADRDLFTDNQDLRERVAFWPTENVFGENGTRTSTDRIIVPIYEMSDLTEGLSLEAWNTGYCEASLHRHEDVRLISPTATLIDLIGGEPALCDETHPPSLHLCARPGSSLENVTFEFTRDFGEEADAASPDN